MKILCVGTVCGLGGCLYIVLFIFTFLTRYEHILLFTEVGCLGLCDLFQWTVNIRNIVFNLIRLTFFRQVIDFSAFFTKKNHKK